jgi:hypothetical protein
MPKKNNPKNEEPSQDEWIWGNHRGGGGAPLVDRSGTCAQLKSN